jgi:hypothetical protein
MMNQHLIGIIADTHDNRKAIQKAVELFNDRGVGLVLHAGDLISPFTAWDFKKLTCKFIAVFGNNDGEKLGLFHLYREFGEISPGPRRIVHNGKKIVLMHEPACIDEMIASPEVDVIVYGHIHKVDIREGKPFIINPGEGGGWLYDTCTAALLDMESMKVAVVSL